jgi:hypothetical protein
MSKILLLDKLVKQYKLWTIKHSKIIEEFHDNILQTDQSRAIEEKVMSIAISSIIVWILTAILSLFGFILGVIGMIFFFVIGIFLSKSINKKIFGQRRKYEELNDEEKNLINHLIFMESKYISIRNNINKGLIKVNFTNYVSLKDDYKNTISILNDFDTKQLAYKYKIKHPILVSKYKILIKKFDYIYANKKD